MQVESRTCVSGNHQERLFRDEALDALNMNRYGRPIAKIPRLWAYLAALLGLIVVCAVWYLTTSTYSRKEAVAGWLIPDEGLVRLSAGQLGVVESLMVEEGALVAKGEPILILSSDSGLVGGGRATEALLTEISREQSELETQIYLAETGVDSDIRSLRASIASMKREQEILQDQIVEQDRRMRIASGLLVRYENLLQEGAGFQMEVERQREAVSAQRQSKSALTLRLQSLTRERQLREDRLEKLPLEKKEAVSQLRTQLSVLVQRRTELLSRGQQVITSPVTGTITMLGAKYGSSIDSRHVLAEILPERSSLFAEIYLPSRAIGLVEEGQVVRLMFEAFPHQRFGSGEGVISRITHTTLRPEEIPTPLRMEESAYKAYVSLKAQSINAFGRSFPLRPGMTLQAEIILEERTFLQWLLEPVIARRGWRSSA